MLYWFLKRVVVGPILNLLFRPWVDGEQNIPEKGAAIFASNHLSFSDSFFLPLVVPRRMTFVAKADYFTGTGIKGRLTDSLYQDVFDYFARALQSRSGATVNQAAVDAVNAQMP